MKLLLERISGGPDSTIGCLYIDGRFEVFTCEDQHQAAEKVCGETRIPAGTYWLALRKYGGFHDRYSQRFADIHRGMLELKSVPNFQHILIHVGNDDDDTAGCILVGTGANCAKEGGGSITSSVRAYKHIYPRIAAALERGEDVSINIRDRDLRI